MDTQTIIEEPNSEKRGIMVRVIKWLSSLLGRWVTAAVIWLAEFIHGISICRYIPVKIIRYGICGVSNYIILDAILYYVTYHYIIGENTYINAIVTVIPPHIASLAIVFPITFLTGFWLNRHVAFGSTEMGFRRQLRRYALSIVGSILLSYLLLKGLVDVCGIWPTPAKIIGSLTTSLYSYLMARLYTFKK